MSTLFGNANLFPSQQQPSIFSQSQNTTATSNGINNVSNPQSAGPTSNIQNSSNHLNNSSNTNPTWFQNSKKRVIPNHLVPKKRAGFHVTSSSSGSSNPSSSNSKSGTLSSSSSTSASKKDSKSPNFLSSLSSSNSNDFNLISFGSNVHRNTSASVGSLYDASIGGGDITKYDETINDTLHEEFSLYETQDDLPPSRSIYDLNDEVLLSLNEPSKQHSDSFLNKDPKDFNNVFNRATASSSAVPVGGKDEKQSSTSIIGTEILNDSTTAGAGSTTVSETLKSLKNGDSAILVFGYPESMANQVIQHFQAYGSILEDFEATKTKHHFTKYYHQQSASRDFDSTSASSQIIPLFTGHSWVKLTFDNPASAINALRENGSVFNGVLLGVIPYNKYALEKLEKRKLQPGEDIGGGLELSLYATSSSPTAISTNNNNIPSSSNAINPDSENQSSYSNKLDIKDGSGFFLHAKNVNDQSKPDETKKGGQIGILNSISKYLFGINEL
ncbi:nucleoporin Nup53p [[Candida] railenensis]|uniref:Nucleoporin Nup53p n=1 Tax=[Candida] railenensis TaxID=45579 RepID=A0A9P0QRZ0_9ASCO|nr:nucleoporin Nup53p [[Candida] railenensis]